MLASRSVAWPLGLVGLPAVLTALLGHSPLPAKGPTIGFAAWTLIAVGLAASRVGAPSSRVWLAGAAGGSAVLAALWIAREGASDAPAYGSLKVQLFIVLNLIAFVGGVFVGRNRRWFGLLTTLWVVLATVTAVALAQGLSSGAANAAVGGRISLDARNGPISLGRDAATGILVAVSFLLTSRGGGRQVFAFATLPVIAIAFIASGSRGPVLGLVVGLTVLLALTLRERRARARMVFVAGGAVLAAVLVTQLVPGQDVHRALSVLTGSASSNGRNAIWAAAWQVFRTHPLFGTGTGSFAVVAPPELYPHNLFLEVGAELGIVGLVVLGVIVVSGARAAWQAVAGAADEDRAQAALLAALLTATFVNAQFSGDVTTNSDLWLLFGLALGMRERLPLPATVDVVHRVRAWRREAPVRGRRTTAPERAKRAATPWLQGPGSPVERTPGEIVLPREGATVGGVVEVVGRAAETGWGVASVQIELSADGGRTWTPVPHSASAAYDVVREVDGLRERVAVTRTQRSAALLSERLAELDEDDTVYSVERATRPPWHPGGGWSIDWDTGTLADGSYLLRAVTRDIAGGRVETDVRAVAVAAEAGVALPALGNDAQALTGRLTAIEEREQALVARAEALEQQERATEERVAALDRREAELTERVRGVTRREQELIRRVAELGRRVPAPAPVPTPVSPPVPATVEPVAPDPVVVQPPAPAPDPLPRIEPKRIAVPTLLQQRAGFNLNALARAVAERPAADELVQAEREETLVALRPYADYDDNVPPQFHAMVLDVFGDLV